MKKKTYKQRVLDAQLDLIKRYKENNPPTRCPLCEIYTHKHNYDCHGCFMRSKDGRINCSRFSSYINSPLMHYRTSDQRLARAKFHEKIRPKLMKWPARYFTPNGWKYFHIPKSW